jgi:DNA-binding transcriptional LysR family regulator
MDLDAIFVYVKVVQAGSFSGAARLLAMPTSTVSAKVARLEKRLGVTLIRRTTRKLHVTPAGQAYYGRCVRGLSEIETAEAEIHSAGAQPRGILRVTAPGDVAQSVLPPIVSQYVRRYGDTMVEVLVANRLVDLLGEGVDIAIRAAELRDSTLVARRLMPFTGGLWASSDYVAQRGMPRSAADLAQHDLLGFSRRGEAVVRLRDGRQQIELPVSGRVLVDDLSTLLKHVLQSDGIGGLPDFVAGEHAALGTLVRVMPDWTWKTGSLSLVYPQQPFVPAKVRAFIDLAIESVKQSPPGK